ncbi:MAG: hypothetical protein ACF8NJ_09170 [Phycisphaerales bacterium JB038]
MHRRIVLAGLLGGLVLLVWTFVVNGLLGFQARLDMKQLPEERQVYELLREQVTEPGRYVCNPAVTAERRFPDHEPAFSILYGGVGHEAAGRHMLFGLVIFLAMPILAAWLLGHASERLLRSYPRKLCFFVGLGLLLAVLADLGRFGIAAYPLGDALQLAAARLLSWTLVGAVVAALVRPSAAPARADVAGA